MDEQVFGSAAAKDRPLTRAIGRGLRGRCPHCGQAGLFGKFLKVADACGRCGETYHHHRADDLPAYLVVLIVGHVVIGAFLGLEKLVPLSAWQHLAIWTPVTLAATLALLQPVKGAVVGLQWALRMHGFSGRPDTLEDHPEL